MALQEDCGSHERATLPAPAAPWKLLTGRVVSDGASKLTVTVKLIVPTFPAASLAVHVTVVVPIGNKKPEDGEQVGPEVTPTLSVTEGLKLIL